MESVKKIIIFNVFVITLLTVFQNCGNFSSQQKQIKQNFLNGHQQEVEDLNNQDEIPLEDVSDNLSIINNVTANEGTNNQNSESSNEAELMTLESSGLVYKDSVGSVWDHYAFAWNSSYLYINQSGTAMVVKELDVEIHARDGIGESGFDLCAVIMKDGDKGTSNDVEQVCFNAYKRESDKDFYNTKVHIVFPGQGLYFPRDTYFVFNGQGVSQSGSKALNFAADVKFKATFAKADPSLSLQPVQALRAPYIDQFFYGSQSSYTPHTNTTNLARPVLGVWTYIGSNGPTSITNCYGIKSPGGQWGQMCSTFDSSHNKQPGPVEIQKLGYSFNPGDQIGAQCQVNTGDNSEGTICASYFYVAVPKNSSGEFLPLKRHETIVASDAEKFCKNVTGFSITDPSLNSQEDCKSLLIQ